MHPSCCCRTPVLWNKLDSWYKVLVLKEIGQLWPVDLMTESQWPIGQGVFDPSIPTVPPGHCKHQSWQSSKVSFERYFQAQYKCAKIFHKFIIGECFNIYQCNYQCHYRITNKIIRLPIYFINFPRKIIYFDQLSQHSVIPVQWIQEQFKYWEMSFAHMNIILPGQL